MNACSQESRLPTQVASLQLEPSRYSELIASLDAAMLSSGLARYGAAPGLNEIYGRNVLYFEYRVHSTDKWAFVTANDLVKVGVVDVRVYSTVLSTEHGRKDAMAKLAEVLAKFGASLVDRETKTGTEKIR